MAAFSYGQKGQVFFNSLKEYYYALGFLANGKNAEICWESNEESGAWGSEGRILCHVPESMFPPNFLFTAGRGDVYARVNCNDYVGTLVTSHGFSYNTRYQNISKILETVPEQYRNDFQAGYGATISSYPPYIGAKNDIYRRSNNSVFNKPVSRKTPQTNMTVKRGDIVYHKTFGKGEVVFFDGKNFKVQFSSCTKIYQVPSSIELGIIKLLGK